MKRRILKFNILGDIVCNIDRRRAYHQANVSLFNKFNFLPTWNQTTLNIKYYMSSNNKETQNPITTKRRYKYTKWRNMHAL